MRSQEIPAAPEGSETRNVMSDHRVKFQNLLRELFQFGCADLDFGIYRTGNMGTSSAEPGNADVPSAVRDAGIPPTARGTDVSSGVTPTGRTQEDYQRERDFVAEHKLTEDADDVYVNGASLIPGARSPDRVFKERLFAKVEA